MMVYQAHQELIGRIQIPREQVRVPGQQIALDSGEAGLGPAPARRRTAPRVEKGARSRSLMEA